jgi:4-carboxymuconolactone decarboxylase
MTCTTHAQRCKVYPLTWVLTVGLGLAAVPSRAQHTQASPSSGSVLTSVPAPSNTLSARQQAIVPIAAFAAAGDIPKLSAALNQGLDAGLAVSDATEVLVQVYAYAGFPRSLNALNELMTVLAARKQRGIQDEPGRAPGRAILKGEALLAAGTANQTQLVGAPVRGPVYEFAPAIDEYLKAHLFGAIFERDNLDWQSRELATVSMLSALAGTEAQLQSHMRVSMNVGLSANQLRQLTQVLADRVDAENARRAREALARQLATRAPVTRTTPEAQRR